MEEYSIYNVNFGQGQGHEQSYSRPAILFKNIDVHRMCLAIPLTSNLEHLNLVHTVQINSTRTTNLKENSVALLFQLRAIDAGRITSTVIGKLEQYQIDKIKAMMKEMLAL